jgi:hypothetical protein
MNNPINFLGGSALAPRPETFSCPGILARLNHSLLESAYSSLTSFQAEIDGATGNFIKEATDPKGLIAMAAGGWANRFLRKEALGLGAIYLSGNPLLTKYGSSLIGLAGESATFAGIQRGFQLAEGDIPNKGFGNDWASAAISLGALRTFGKAGEGQNPILQHLLGDLGLVGSHQLASFAKIEEKLEGDFLTQFIKADLMNWQMKGSASLLSELAPGSYMQERALEVTLLSSERRFSKFEFGNLLEKLLPKQRMAIGTARNALDHSIIMISENKDGNGNESPDRSKPHSEKEENPISKPPISASSIFLEIQKMGTNPSTHSREEFLKILENFGFRREQALSQIDEDIKNLRQNFRITEATKDFLVVEMWSEDHAPIMRKFYVSTISGWKPGLGKYQMNVLKWVKRESGWSNSANTSNVDSFDDRPPQKKPAKGQ